MPHHRKPGPTPAADAADRLAEYRRKRSANQTPEPFGAEATRPGLFVVQKHAATRLHYDFRLEVGGVLRSWAIPKGPSLEPDDKRFAAETEDHPVDYGDFEGVIPEGNYGAGTVIVWDRGLAVHHLEPAQAIEDGKLLFELRGYKLRGLWTLVRTKNEREWLLIKKPDLEATGKRVEELPAASVLSGLTLEEMRDGERRSAEVAARLEALGAPRRKVDPGKVRRMLAKLEPEPFDRPGWLFEIKYDGYRVLAATGGDGRGGARLLYRSGADAGALYPEITRALDALPYGPLVFDGELVALDEEGKPSFGRLQQRARLRRGPDIGRASVIQPTVLFLFDLLAFDGYDLRPLPLTERKALLGEIAPRTGPLRYADHVDERGRAMFDGIRELGLEGLVAKRADAPYRGGRGGDWVKIRAERTGDFAVVGFTEPKGGRTGFGALHLGALEGGRMIYVGRVGSGFDDRLLAELRAALDEAVRPEPSFAGEAPAGAEHRWVDPAMVVEVRYTELTEAGQLRHPVFARLRPDKPVTECLLEERALAEAPPPAPDPRPEVELARPEKVFWPAEGYTKKDLFEYYRAIGPYLLPYLRDRPLVLDRYPDGIEGKSFFQKNAPEFAPDWVQTASIWSEDSGEETLFFVANDLETLLYLINLGTIPLHVWSSRTPALQRPDWSVVDLDAKDAAFGDVVEVARETGKLCRSIGLDAFLKTSGATGLHVLVPLAGALTYAQSRQLAELLARVVGARLPEISSLARSPSARRGKVYLDTLQNGYGKLIVAPFSVRPLPGAPVSMPLRWRELTSKLDPKRFDIQNAPKRLERMKRDPLAGVLEAEPDLVGALERLAELV